MNTRRHLYLATTSLAVVGLLTAPVQSFAQSDAADPPARVGRLATIEGTVSTHTASDDQWAPAVLNAPVSTGDAFWTEPQALAKIEFTGSFLWMDQSTEFDLTTLDDTSVHASEPQGDLYLHLRALQPGETYTIETPRGTVSLSGDGRYDILAGDTSHPTMVSVLDGEAQITGNNISLQVHANQTASITGDTTFEGSVGPLDQDAFLTSMLRREQPAQPRGTAPPAVVAQMTGGEDLNQYGSWDSSPDYGNVWYPQVDSGWAPYRDGRWSYVAPWGWTWVDAAPWGFAPFHYGRWVQIGPRWGWAPVYPGYSAGYRPVYAPALVSFFGVGGGGVGVGVGLGVGFGLGLGAAYGLGANIGWVPLGPREAYYPPYRVSNTYVSRVNVTNVTNVTNIYNGAGARRQLPVNQFVNARGATVVPARAMAESRPVNVAYRRPTVAELSAARPLVDRAPIAPGARTIGLTPQVARQLNVAGGMEQRRAPGPAVQPATAGARAMTRPVLRPNVGGPAAPRAPAPGPTPSAATRPNGLPGLRSPGARPDFQPRPGQPPASATVRPDGTTAAPGPRVERGASSATRPALRAAGATPTERAPSAPRREPTTAQAPRHSSAPVPEPRATRGESPAVPRHASIPREPSAPRGQEPAPPRAAPRAEQPRPQPTERPRIEAARPAAAQEQIRPHAEAPRPQPREAAPRAEPARPLPPRPQADKRPGQPPG